MLRPVTLRATGPPGWPVRCPRVRTSCASAKPTPEEGPPLKTSGHSLAQTDLVSGRVRQAMSQKRERGPAAGVGMGADGQWGTRCGGGGGWAAGPPPRSAPSPQARPLSRPGGSSPDARTSGHGRRLPGSGGRPGRHRRNRNYSFQAFIPSLLPIIL